MIKPIEWIKRKLGIVQYSELALEIKEALEQDEWTADKYCLKHVKSEMQLWVSSSADTFRMYSVPKAARLANPNRSPLLGSLDDEEHKKMLSLDDRKMLYPIATHLHQKTMYRYEDSIVNALRLSRQTESL